MTSKFEIRAGLAGTILMAMNGNLSNSTSVATTEALCLSPSVNVNLTPRPKPTPDIAKFVKEELTEEESFTEAGWNFEVEDSEEQIVRLFGDRRLTAVEHFIEEVVSEFWFLLKLQLTCGMYKCDSKTIPFLPFPYSEEIVFRSAFYPLPGWPEEISVSLRRNEVAFDFKYSCGAKVSSGFFKKEEYPDVAKLIEDIKNATPGI
eukprot:GHVP01013529.1.p1 GENE.GHVP01013529.1~~GHVP01013529.1.p1  ORF type:complete len:217 (+),score=45.75 GHVP01013529.1:41-652(+)